MLLNRLLAATCALGCTVMVVELILIAVTPGGGL